MNSKVSLGQILISYRIGLSLDHWLKPQAESLLTVKLVNIKDMPTSELKLSLDQGTLVEVADKAAVQRSHVLQPEDVLVARKYTDRATSAVAPKKMQIPICVSTNIAVLRVDKDSVLPDYLALWFRSDAAKAHIGEVSKKYYQKTSAKGLNSFSLSALLKLQFHLPDISTQKQLLKQHSAILGLKQKTQIAEARLQKEFLNLDGG